MSGMPDSPRLQPIQATAQAPTDLTMSAAPETLWLRPPALAGRFVRLDPLGPQHADGLFAVGADPDVFRWLPRSAFASTEDAQQWIAAALRPGDDGPQAAFAVVHLASGAVAGSTRYLAIRPEHRRLEIGWTWYGRAYQRTAVNSECKLLLLTHAFEALGARRVEFKTDRLNAASQAALARLGAVQEGVFRQHRTRPDGTVRDTVWYSILAAEWPAIRSRLQEGLRRPG
jgi:RimJ/RimL family protein N-acetyltransferase